MNTPPVPSDRVLVHLPRVLSSDTFRGADRSAAILRFVVERAIAGDADRLKEYTIGVEALGRGASFDPRTDPIVRAEASRLRGRLDRYYAEEGAADDLIIELPKGKYVPRFRDRTPSAPPASSRRRLPSRRAVAWLVIGSSAALAAFAVGAWFERPIPPPHAAAITQLEVQLQPNGSIGSEVGTDVAVAPDGSGVVFVTTDSLGVARLRMRRFNGSPVVDLSGTEGARGPFWSPDGHWVGFWAGGQLKKMPGDGGDPVVLCDAPDLLGASWGDDGTIVAALNSTAKLWQVPATGGTPKAILDLGSSGSPRWPQLLPGGRAVIYTALGPAGADRATIEVASLPGGHRTTLVKGGSFGRFVPPHYLTYVNQGTVYAVRVDPARLTVLGSPVPVVDGIAYSSAFGYAQMSVAGSGLAVYRRAPSHGQSIVVALDSAGHARPLINTPGRYTWPALSPDARRLAVSAVESGVVSTSIFDDLGDRARRRTSRTSINPASVWTADGRFLVSGGLDGLDWIPADGGAAKTLVTTGLISAPWSVSPDGRRLAFSSMSPATAFDLWTVPVTEEPHGISAGTPEPFLRSPFFETYPTFSPDGRWLAYASNAGGSWEVYVRSFPDNGKPVRVSRDGGRIPRWSRNGHELFFATDDQRVMVAAYSVHDATFAAGVPRRWTQVRLADTGVLPGFDLFPDGRHIVALVPAGRDEVETATHVTVILDFVDELRRRLP